LPIKIFISSKIPLCSSISLIISAIHINFSTWPSPCSSPASRAPGSSSICSVPCSWITPPSGSSQVCSSSYLIAPPSGSSPSSCWLSKNLHAVRQTYYLDTIEIVPDVTSNAPLSINISRINTPTLLNISLVTSAIRWATIDGTSSIISLISILSRWNNEVKRRFFINRIILCSNKFYLRFIKMNNMENVLVFLTKSSQNLLKLFKKRTKNQKILQWKAKDKIVETHLISCFDVLW